MTKKELERSLEKVIEKKEKKEKTTWIWAVAIIILGFSFYMYFSTVSAGADALREGYSTAYANEKDSTYQELYKKYFDRAEEKSHVSNRISVSIGELKEVSQLEVLQVSDVEYIVDTGEYGDDFTAWLEVPGTANFNIDLQAAEYVVDDNHFHVLVRIPYPELSNIHIDYDKVQLLLFKNNKFFKNGGYGDGEKLAKDQLEQARSLIEKEFTSNEYYYLNAQKSAKTSIECLIKQLNPNQEGLTVDIEFY